MLKRLTPLATGFVALALLANWLAARYTVHVPLTPYVAPAGVFCIGAILVLRDWMQQLAGLRRTMPLVYAAGLLSWLVGDLAGWTSLEKVAVASVVAFTASETLEALVFTPVRSKNLTLGVALSATLGNALDSYVFLTLAFGSTAFFRGQFWGKNESIALGVILTFARRRALPAAASVHRPNQEALP
ncbi:MAG: VUT family protein [Gaiellaceae bacterium]